MNITRTNNDALSAVITLNVVKDDYEPKVEKALKDYRKKAVINGFRPGMAPMGMVSKMYRKPLLLEEINKLIEESLKNYIADNDLKILGEPLPLENQETIDFDSQSDFNFAFEIGLSPEFNIEPGKNDVLPYYLISLSDEMVEKSKESYSKRYGSFVNTTEITGNEMLKGEIEQITGFNESEDEKIKISDSSIFLDIMKDEKEKEKFLGKQHGDEIEFDLRTAFPNDYEISSILKIEKEYAPSINGIFKFKIQSIAKFANAEYNKELFDKIYGSDNTISTEEEFNEKIKEEIRTSFLENSEYRLLVDTKQFYTNKLGLKIPESFLKRWLLAVNEGKLEAEQLENEFPSFVKDLQWQLIRDRIMSQFEIKIENEDIIQKAKRVAMDQFRNYGINNIPDEHLERYAVDMLKNENEVRRLVDLIRDEKAVNAIKEKVTLSEKLVTLDEFNKLFDN